MKCAKKTFKKKMAIFVHVFSRINNIIKHVEIMNRLIFFFIVLCNAVSAFGQSASVGITDPRRMELLKMEVVDIKRNANADVMATLA